jgi:6-pyruvoyltetrahydropterin/6-carboxytetrahydropterin synthase
MSNRYVSTKVIPLGSCAFRQPLAKSHCRFIHGYRLQAKFWFTCSSLDSNNWVVDFGALKELKNILEETFDHKTVVSGTDPDLDMFKELDKRDMIELVIMADGVGIENFANFCFEVADDYIKESTYGRCWVQKVEVWEHEGNSAIYEKTSPDHVWKS